MTGYIAEMSENHGTKQTVKEVHHETVLQGETASGGEIEVEFDSEES